MKRSGSSRLTISESILDGPMPNKVSMLGAGRQGGLTVISTRPSAEPFTSHWPRRPWTPFVPPTLACDRLMERTFARDVQLEGSHPDLDLGGVNRHARFSWAERNNRASSQAESLPSQASL